MLWLNLGDSYGSGTRKSLPPQSIAGHYRNEPGENNDRGKQGFSKQLIGIPWRVAFALQADGWYLRSDIIWHKPNPMPESVTDRPTKSHEYVFLLTKSAKYYYDADAIKEQTNDMNTKPRSFRNGDAKATLRNDEGNDYVPRSDRNKRSVWTITTQPYRDAHFATFPEELPRTCILAGCPEGGIVLDPFAGSGTVGQVAESHGRNSILIELNPKYVTMIKKRTAQQVML